VCQVCVGVYSFCLLLLLLLPSTEHVPCWAETRWLLVCGLERDAGVTLFVIAMCWWPPGLHLGRCLCQK
jgi:hypothetical protein